MSCISFLNTCPSSGDTEQQLLSKILQVINTTGGGIAGVSSISINGGAPQTGAVAITTGGTVTSVNGDPGPAVSLDSGEIPEGANLYFTEPRTLATDLAGFAAALGAITAADTILSAFGKTQGRLAALEAGTAGPFLLKAGDTGTGAFLFTPTVVDVVPLTLTSAVGSATTSSLFVATGGATNRLTLRNDGRFILSGRILATNTDVLGHALNFSDAGTANAPILLALGHTSTAGLGTAAAGFGGMLDWNLDSTTTLATRAVRETAAWTVATHATRTASLTFFAFTGGSETTQLTLTNNQIQGGDGTVALPTFSDRNYPATGMYFSAANELSLSTSATNRLRITSAGFVGIAATAPLTLLQVGNPTGTYFPTTKGNAVNFFGADTLFGQFGIWSTDAATINKGGTMFFGGENTVAAGATSPYPFAGFRGAKETAAADYSGYLAIYTTESGSAVSEKVRVTSTGLVGIGMTAPTARLAIANSTTTTAVHVYHTFTDASNYSRAVISNTAAGAGNQKVNLAAETAGTGADNIDVRLIPSGTGSVFLDAGVPIAVSSGTNQRAGNTTLVGGTVTVANTTVTANTVIMLTRKTSGGTIGTAIQYSTIAATSFTITSDSVLDTSVFSYFLIEVP